MSSILVWQRLVPPLALDAKLPFDLWITEALENALERDGGAETPPGLAVRAFCRLKD